jgi:hypothetical protein
MNDELIGSNEIYIQEIVCSTVARNPKADDFALYNIISTMVDISTLETTDRILNLIKMNKSALDD